METNEARFAAKVAKAAGARAERQREKMTRVQILEEALANFPGCVLVTSHDRFFLDRLATPTLHFDGEGGARSILWVGARP